MNQKKFRDVTRANVQKKRAKTRKTEISRDFSVFFDSNFFRISIDPFSIFFQVEEFELLKTHYFENFITNETNTKDLNPRQGFILFRFLCQSQNVYKQYITKQIHRFSKRIRTREMQKIVFPEIDPFATSKDSNQRITKIDLLKPKKKATATKPWQILFDFNSPTNWNLVNKRICF